MTSICCKTVLPFRQHQVIREWINALDLDVGPVRDELLPVLLGRIADRRGDDAEVLGVLVRADVEEVAAMLDVVFVIGARAARSIFSGADRRGGRQIAHFSGGLRGDLQRR